MSTGSDYLLGSSHSHTDTRVANMGIQEEVLNLAKFRKLMDEAPEIFLYLSLSSLKTA